MAVEAQPDYRVNIYGDSPNPLLMEMAYGGARGGGGGIGLPWVRPDAPSPNRTSTSGTNTTTGSDMPTRTTGTRVGDVGNVLSGASGGAATERERKMWAAQQGNQNALDVFRTRQQAALEALLAQGRDKMSGYATQQGATTNAMTGLQSATTTALGNQSAEGLARARLGLEAPGVRARQSVLGSLMKNLQPLSIQSAPGQRGHETKLSGGMSAAALDPLTREHGAALLQAALEAQLSGSDVPAATDFKGGIQDWKSSILNVPEATDYSKGLLNAPQLQDTYQKPGKLESIMSWLGLGGNLAGAIMK